MERKVSINTIALLVIAVALVLGLVGAGAYWWKNEQRAAEQQRVAAEMQDRAATAMRVSEIERQIASITSSGKLLLSIREDYDQLVEEAKTRPRGFSGNNQFALRLLSSRLHALNVPACAELAKVKLSNALKNADTFIGLLSEDTAGLNSLREIENHTRLGFDSFRAEGSVFCKREVDAMVAEVEALEKKSKSKSTLNSKQ
jgi:hypothetical protein